MTHDTETKIYVFLGNLGINIFVRYTEKLIDVDYFSLDDKKKV